MHRRKIVTYILVTAYAVGLSSCARLFPHRSGSAKHSTELMLTADKTSFYKYGPQQSQGPDRQLPKDTRVTVVRHAFGYSKVRLPDGQQGFVANDQLSRAPEKLIAQADASDDSADGSSLPPTPSVKLPASDSSPEYEPTPIPAPLMPQ
jgi:hypothetical protein